VPPKEGSTLVLWVLPVAALLAGAGWLFYTLRRWKKPVAISAVGPAPAAAQLPDDDYLKQVEKDLEAH
jgi:cytochrome c-type biogenesis protein CcmH/NrfF